MWKRKKAQQEAEAQRGEWILVSAKGIALVAAVESGLVKEAEDGQSYDTELFEKFWEKFTMDLVRNGGAIRAGGGWMYWG